MTNQQWCPGDGPIDPRWIVQAINAPTLCSEADWAAWSGDHRGNWYDVGAEFVDHAIWDPPTARDSEAGAAGVVQAVHCYVESPDGQRTPQRCGWNASINGQAHVIGWDPKRICDVADPRQAVHVGFPFRPPMAGDDRHCIVWVLWHEAFLECVDTSNRRRTSARVIYSAGDDEPGFGQWTIESVGESK